MVELQIINRVLQTQDISILDNNQLDAEYFPQYAEEYDFIMNHYKEYKNVPDKATFLSQFNEFDFIEVTESEEYLVNKIREEYLYSKSVPVVQNIAKLLKTDANSAVEYMMQAMKDLKPNYDVGGVDIIQQATKRLDAYIDRRDNQDNWFFTTGFPELDDITHGIQRSEELVLIFARTNQGKSWVLEKICTHIWEIGFNVGFISPEMGELSVGYRFDTLHKNFSNRDLMWGNDSLDESAYKNYIDELKQRQNKFIVATPSDFGNRLTVTKIRKFVEKHKLDVVAIDGVTYLEDERYKRGDTEAQKLTHLGEDLMNLSRDINIPILVVAQANRSGAIDKESEDTPEVESVRGGDGISINASKLISLKQNQDGVITMQIKKQRNGRVGDKISYNWNPDIGEFISENGVVTSTVRQKKKVVEKEDVF